MLSTQSENQGLTDHNVLVARLDFKAGDIFARHTHDVGQFSFAVTGGVSMLTDEGSWILPAQRAIWIPADISHEMHMHGAVTMLNTFIGNGVLRRTTLPSHCQVYGVSELLRNLFEAILAVSPGSSLRRRRLEALLLDELSGIPRLPLSVQLPKDTRVLGACKHLLASPSQNFSIDDMASIANMSRRTFTRQFRETTGMSFVAWRKHACILEALSRLNLGASIKDVAVDLGYSSTSAFSSTFRQILGESPMRYLTRALNRPTSEHWKE